MKVQYQLIDVETKEVLITGSQFETNDLKENDWIKIVANDVIKQRLDDVNSEG